MKTFDKKIFTHGQIAKTPGVIQVVQGFFLNSLEDLSSGTQNSLELSSTDASSAACFKPEGSTVSYAFFVPWSKVIDLDDCVRIPRYFQNDQKCNFSNVCNRYLFLWFLLMVEYSIRS